MTNEEKWIEYRRSVGLPDQSPTPSGQYDHSWNYQMNCSNRDAMEIYSHRNPYANNLTNKTKEV